MVKTKEPKLQNIKDNAIYFSSCFLAKIRMIG